MYKVFFQDRVVFLTENAPPGKATSGQLFAGFHNPSGLKDLLDDFSRNEQVRELHIFHPDLAELIAAFSGCFISVRAGGGVVLNPKGKFLVIERNGLWDMPKGKVENGENFETAALREVGEETGLSGLESKGLLLSTFHTYELSGRMMLKETRWFEMDWKGKGKPVLQADEGITGFRWVKPGETGFIRENTYASILDVLSLRNLL
jgi:8-oxo-dGTP pyrophosphatase MutT (NUDIX family)